MLRIILVTILRVFVGAVLVASSIGKMLDIPGFIKVLETYQALPLGSLPAVAILLVLAELKVAEMLLWPGRLRSGALASMLLHLMFTFFATATYFRGISVPNCGCFGVFWARPLTALTIGEDLLMLVLSACLYRFASAKS